MTIGRGLRVLVVEDEPLIAMALVEELEGAGLVVVGSTATLGRATDLAAREPIDAAVLDVRLGNETVFPLADILTAQGVPFVFTTGLDGDAIDDKYAGVPRCEKPFTPGAVVDELRGVVTRWWTDRKTA